MINQPSVVEYAFLGEFSEGAWKASLNMSLITYCKDELALSRLHDLGWRVDIFRKHGVRCFFGTPKALEGPNLHFVFFEGSNPNLDDWKRNIDARPCRVNDTSCYDHMGYRKGMLHCYDWIQRRRRHNHIFTGGHSQGAGLARSYCIHQKTTRDGFTNMALYDFGGPKTLSREAVDRLRMSMGSRIYNTVNQLDIVPLAGFGRHPGTLIYLSDDTYYYNPKNPLSLILDRTKATLSYEWGERTSDHKLREYAKTIDNLFGLAHTDILEHELKDA